MVLKNTKKMQKRSKKIEEIEKPKNGGSLHANDVLGDSRIRHEGC